MLAEEIQNKWKPVLDHADLPEIKDAYRRMVTAQVLENTEKALTEAALLGGSQQLLGEAAPVNVAGNVTNFDPV